MTKVADTDLFESRIQIDHPSMGSDAQLVAHYSTTSYCMLHESTARHHHGKLSRSIMIFQYSHTPLNQNSDPLNQPYDLSDPHYDPLDQLSEYFSQHPGTSEPT